MNIRDDRRRAALSAMADHLLAEGLAGASLRPLAAAAGTSDRMLLYYFADKDELLTATLAEVAGRLIGLLEAAVGPARPTAYEALLSALWGAFRSPDLAPYMRLWLDLSAAASRGQEPFRTIAGGIADGFLAWGAARLDVADSGERARQAALLLATVDGLALLDAVGRGAAADLAAGSGLKA